MVISRRLGPSTSVIVLACTLYCALYLSFSLLTFLTFDFNLETWELGKEGREEGRNEGNIQEQII